MKTLIVSGKEELVVQQLARIDAKQSADQKCIEFKSAPGVMLNVNVLELPEDLGDGPQAIIATMVKQLGVQVSEKDGKLDLAIHLTAVDADTGEQLEQMLQGIAPMIEGQLGGAEDLQVSREGMVVKLGSKMDAKEAANLIEGQFDTMLGMVEGLLGNR